MGSDHPDIIITNDNDNKSLLELEYTKFDIDDKFCEPGFEIVSFTRHSAVVSVPNEGVANSRHFTICLGKEYEVKYGLSADAQIVTDTVLGAAETCL